MNQDRLKELLCYEATTGNFVWNMNRKGTAKKGSVAGATRTGGYRQIMVDGKMYAAHRLAWFYVYGYWPEFQIDHINHVRDDNRIENLRCVTPQQNNQNRLVNCNNTSGVAGVYWFKAGKKWHASIRHNKKSIHLGYYISKEKAIAKRKEYEQKLWREES